MLPELHKSLHVVQLESTRQRLRVDYAKRIVGNKNQLHEIFNENRIAGMLKSFDYYQADKVSPFLGAIVDHLCKTSDTAVNTLVFSFYVELVN